MHPYPHVYEVSAGGAARGPVSVSARGLPPLETTPPPQFDGPEGFWSPETLLCAAVADCLILTFRGIARAARVEWVKLECRVEGTLERREGAAQFTRFATVATLTVSDDVQPERARSLLERAEHACLISNSLRAERTLQTEIVTVTRAVAQAALESVRYGS
jgi:organic hydroperoxide reductase OsmC/OhrA